jgi:tetratricopeptide (TPR) repeat protein
MDSRQRARLIAAIGLLVFLGLVLGVWRMGLRFADFIQASQVKTMAAAHAAESLPVKAGHLFTNDKIYTFLAAAKKAELIEDPLQRCLAYPDPPDSHWSATAVKAYCRYRTQALMSFADLQSLIQNGQSAQLDQRMAQMLAANTQPNSRGVLDRTFEQDFDGSFDVRQILDAWKRALPKSAFAYAASGYAYEKMAGDARGTDYIQNTPASNIESMTRLMQQADTDLRQAIALNPHITPAYLAMIHVGAMDSGDFVATYAADAGKGGLAADPANYSIYDAMMWQAEPKWGGSLNAMRQINAVAQTHAGENPVLVLLQSKTPGYDKLDYCDCHSEQELSTYPTIFDQVSSARQLLNAGHAAEQSRNLGLAVVYFSEALRFDETLSDERLRRVYDLNNFDESQWAVDEASRLMRAAPGDEDPVVARAYSYEMLNDYTHAIQDLQAALVINPDDKHMLSELAGVYVHQTHEWDKGWYMATRLMHAYPDDAYAWILRADIQEHQPRAGLQDTIDFFATHFDDTPQHHSALLRMRAAQALQPKSLSQTSIGKGASHG